MRQQEFDRIVADLHETEIEIQRGKCADYAEPNRDVLSNFKRAAESAGVDPLKVCWIYIFKHLCAVRAYVRGHRQQTDDLAERVIDLRNYLALFLALDKEQRRQ